MNVLNVNMHRDFFSILFKSIRDFYSYKSLMLTCKILYDIGKQNIPIGIFESHYKLCLIRQKKSNLIKKLGYIHKHPYKRISNPNYCLHISKNRMILSTVTISKKKYKTFVNNKTLVLRVYDYEKRHYSILHLVINSHKVVQNFKQEIANFIREFRNQKIYVFIPETQKQFIEHVFKLAF